jgi:N-glycosylase/DNA lyase
MKYPKLSHEEIYRLYAERQSAIRQRLGEFSKIHPSEYFYELVYCILTPQSSAANAANAVDTLKLHDFANNDIDPAPLLHQKDFYIRFHHTKGRRLIGVKKQFPHILQHLSNGSASFELREWLVDNVKGIGYKEASHFLRNIGHRDLAILDRHILKNLRRCAVLRSPPKTMTRKRYLAIEKKFLKFAEQIGISMDELDLLFWSMETGRIMK